MQGDVGRVAHWPYLGRRRGGEVPGTQPRHAQAAITQVVADQPVPVTAGLHRGADSDRSDGRPDARHDLRHAAEPFDSGVHGDRCGQGHVQGVRAAQAGRQPPEQPGCVPDGCKYAAADVRPGLRPDPSLPGEHAAPSRPARFRPAPREDRGCCTAVPSAVNSPYGRIVAAPLLPCVGGRDQPQPGVRRKLHTARRARFPTAGLSRLPPSCLPSPPAAALRHRRARRRERCVPQAPGADAPDVHVRRAAGALADAAGEWPPRKKPALARKPRSACSPVVAFDSRLTRARLPRGSRRRAACGRWSSSPAS